MTNRIAPRYMDGIFTIPWNGCLVTLQPPYWGSHKSLMYFVSDGDVVKLLGVSCPVKYRVESIDEAIVNGLAELGWHVVVSSITGARLSRYRDGSILFGLDDTIIATFRCDDLPVPSDQDPANAIALAYRSSMFKVHSDVLNPSEICSLGAYILPTIHHMHFTPVYKQEIPVGSIRDTLGMPVYM